MLGGTDSKHTVQRQAYQQASIALTGPLTTGEQ